ncbi:MAG: SDR family oxidoreductase [Kiritimatiellaceae bacterium]|nr:MAG: SDR family oxidoreductase [Kiritimatiellaceae bacterium]
MRERILIVGATSDMGQAFARRCALRGAELILAARDAVALDRMASDLRVRVGGTVHTVEFDALKMEEHAEFYRDLPVRPDGVICFVGWLGEAEVCQQSFEAARRVLDTNFTGVVSVLDRVAEEFEKRGKGWIVGVSSVAGDRGRAPRYHYGSAKAGLNAYLSGLRQRLWRSRVLVMNVKPGYCRTKMVAGWDLPGAMTSEPDEVAGAILRAIDRGQETLYVRWMWRWIMGIIRLLPEPIFKRLKI